MTYASHCKFLTCYIYLKQDTHITDYKAHFICDAQRKLKKAQE